MRLHEVINSRQQFKRGRHLCWMKVRPYEKYITYSYNGCKYHKYTLSVDDINADDWKINLTDFPTSKPLPERGFYTNFVPAPASVRGTCPQTDHNYIVVGAPYKSEITIACTKCGHTIYIPLESRVTQ
jgi:hypothetical protein